MSLFKARDWWSVVVEGENGQEEECDIGCLAVANINNETPSKDKIIVGGFSGSLRIYHPQAFRTEEGEEVSGYRADHVLLETTLNYPILQLAVGKFVSSNDHNHLCVLHPDRLAVYTVTTDNATAQKQHGQQFRLTSAYQHKLPRKAYSLLTGAFGGVKGKDYLAVQSLDGCLSVFEQESQAFTTPLPNTLLPGPLAYLSRNDSIVVAGSDWCLHCYKYQAIAVAATDNPSEGNSSASNKSSSQGSKRLSPEWTQLLGEPVLDMKVVGEGAGASLVVLTQRSFSCLKDSGVFKFIKKLEYNPACLNAFMLGNAVQVLVASHTETLLVYHETELRWASQLPFVPVTLTRTNFEGIRGGLVTLGSSGHLQVSYLGTDPSLFVAPPTDARQINYDQTDQELAKLHKVIKASTKDAGSLLNVNKGVSGGMINENDLRVYATVGNQLETWTGPGGMTGPDGVGVPAVPVAIRLTAHSPLNSVRVHISVEKPLAVSQDTFVLRTICDTSQILVKFYQNEAYLPPSLTVTFVTSFLTSTGAPRIITTNVELPLKLVVQGSQPSKEADHKLTISTNMPAVNLPELFPELAGEAGVATAMGLQYFNETEVTILSSRTTNRYRLQSDSLAALWLVLKELIARLRAYWGRPGWRGKVDELLLGAASPLPTNELYAEIDAHFLRRKKHKELEAQLVQRATQFRAVQRRLLTKFKDKTPTPLTNLDNLLEGTYKQILHITDLINENIKGLEQDGSQLSCVVRLVLEMARLQTNMEPNHYSLLIAALSPIIHPTMDQGWEERTDACVTFLLRNVLGKNVTIGGQAGRDAPPPPQLTMPQDTGKLKKHVSILLDKVTKAAQQLVLSDPPQDTTADTREETIYRDENDLAEPPTPQAPEDPTQVPLGSRLGEDRARSARIRSSRLLSGRTASTLPPLTPSSSVGEERDEERGTLTAQSSEASQPDESVDEENLGDLPSPPTEPPDPTEQPSTPPNEQPDSTQELTEDLAPQEKLQETLKILPKPTLKKEATIETPDDIFDGDDGDMW
ncbi:hypothetical protein Pcinc_019466 [Petrolisthes cinctipes]|uniref:Protein PTHB1 n=1 Tax=Petrolisthes cinctipes TaxID=88211 RepID=A0AAE1FK28_PETCI|nr:hypothetical protein Pcinc_019466 [Petrolisthes cinctipes]